MSAQGVYTDDIRIGLVSGWLTGGVDPGDGSVECGSGTAFPLKVTLRELAEIVYRVKDARMGGYITSDFGFAAMSLLFSDGEMPPDYYSGTNADVIVQRSYATTDDPPVNIEQERPVWTNPHATPVRGAGSVIPITLSHGLVTGFTQYAESFVFPASGYYPYGDAVGTEYPAGVELAFGSHLAFIDNAANGSIFDPANELWMEVAFIGYTDDNFLLDVYAATTPQALTDVMCGTLTLELAEGGSVSCELYGRVETTAALTLTANRWFPYRKNSPTRPVWNPNDGTRIPENAGNNIGQILPIL